jgi:carbamoyl-phosphate synthase large subunit
MKRILVSGAGGSAAYNFIESLRNNPEKEKFYIVGADISQYHIELANVDKRYLLPKISDSNYLKKLNELINKEKIDFLHGQPDAEVLFFSKNRKKIYTKTFLPEHKTIEICQNKMELTTLLKKAKVNVPEAYHVTSKEDLKESMNTLLKTNEKVWIRAIRGAGSRAALPVKKSSHAQMWVDYWRVMKGLKYSDFMVSEFLPGKEYAFQSFWWKGELLMSQARERKQYIFGNLTPSGQSSSPSVAVTVDNDQVNKTAYNAIKAIDKNATGIFCVDLKTNKEGLVTIIEINAGRFFTTSYFFSSAGLNMPYYYTKKGLNKEFQLKPNKIKKIKPGIYWIRMIDMGYKLITENEWASKKI